MTGLLGRLPGEARLIETLRKRGLWRKLANYLLVESELAMGRTRLLGKPYWMTVDPASFCQLRCPFCPTGAGRNVRPKARMSLESFERILRDLGPTLIHIDFMNWGEPLLNADIYSMVAAAKRFKIDSMLSTNLLALDRDSAERMVDCGLDRVTLSIDGLTQETYEKYRVGGDFSRVLENLRLLVETKRAKCSRTPHIVWQFLVFKHNEHEIERVREFALSRGADEAGLTPACLPFRPGIRDEWLPTRREYSLYDPENFPESPPWHWKEAQAPAQDGGPASVKVEVYKEPRALCRWPWAGITVNPDGSVSPCCSVEEKEYDFGSYDGRSFRSLWNNEAYRRGRAHILRYAARAVETLPSSSHACERCFSIGRSGFQIPHTWYAQ
ncbi:MAG: radical SAM protein [Elusimicrobiota bacterium]|jgi:MoaA/NifB/PqqE/SkfB family radical SAM enzyme